MKLIKYDPNEVKNISEFFNNEIKKCDEKYIMFLFNDIYNEVINIDDFMNAYENLMEKNNLPFAFFPYYVHFNKVLNDFIKFPNPRAHITFEDNKFDIVNQPGMGMLSLNLEKIKDFKFSGKFNEAFYVQEVVMYCVEKDLYFSKLYFYDVFESWKFLKTNITKGYLPNVKLFKEEKKAFYQNYNQEDEGINNFLLKIKNIKLNNNEIKMDMPELEELSNEEKIK